MTVVYPRLKDVPSAALQDAMELLHILVSTFPGLWDTVEDVPGADLVDELTGHLQRLPALHAFLKPSYQLGMGTITYEELP